MRCLSFWGIWLLMFYRLPAQAQSTRPEDLGPGKLLVAAKDLADPNFAKTVVLVIQFDRDGVAGLVLNRRSEKAISEVLDKVDGAEKRSDTVFSGGPVMDSAVLALVRSGKAGGGATNVLADVSLISKKEDLERAFLSGTAPARVHVYVGYAGWTMEQLAHEVDLGAWFIFPANAAQIFDANPETLWPRLIRETEMHVAGNIIREAGPAARAF